MTNQDNSFASFEEALTPKPNFDPFMIVPNYPSDHIGQNRTFFLVGPMGSTGDSTESFSETFPQGTTFTRTLSVPQIVFSSED